jgi:hypothetical protein
MGAALIIALCIASAVLGRLILTREEARRTITVRLPALLMLVVSTLLMTSFWLFYAVVCFIGGSFYGLGQWWWPQLFEVLDFNGTWLGPVITGRWEP